MQNKNRQFLILAWAIVLAFFTVLRFFHLDADFPSGLDTRKSPLTDEGFYLTGAVRKILFDYWILDSDHNTIVNHPTFTFLNFFFLKFFGVSLVKARIFHVFIHLALVFVFMLLLKKLKVNLPSIFVFLTFVLINKYLFFYSRIAFVEEMMILFLILAVYFYIDNLEGKIHFGRAFLSLLFLFLAYNSKANAIVFYPTFFGIILLFPCVIGKKIKKLIFLVFHFGVFFALKFLLYVAFQVKHYHYLSYQSFISVQERLITDLSNFVYNVFRTYYQFIQFDFSNLLVALVFVVFLGIRYKKPFHGLGWAMVFTLVGSYGIILASSSYQPVRYFIPFYFFLGLGVALISNQLFIGKRINKFEFKFYVAIMLIYVVWNGFFITRNMLQPTFTYMTSIQEMGKTIKSSKVKEPLLLGDLTPQMAIEMKYPFINHFLAVSSLMNRTEIYKPTHMIIYKEELEEVKQLKQRYDFDLLYSNPFHLADYFSEIQLYRLIRKDSLNKTPTNRIEN